MTKCTICLCVHKEAELGRSMKSLIILTTLHNNKRLCACHGNDNNNHMSGGSSIRDCLDETWQKQDHGFGYLYLL